ncbi:MAG TPA: PAS domain S-box protein [Chloroflexota bacterium]|nr:PAS domain S-box protein [Chloroflexota bacterium]HUM70958.1 PAS domain S-box protein [Chloroflexota bacterium]
MSEPDHKLPNQELEAALQESETRYRHLVEASPLGIAVHANEKIVYINPEAIRLMGGQTADDFLGRSIWSFIHPNDLAGVKERIRQLYTMQQDVNMVEEKFIRLDGRAIDVAVAATSVSYMGVRASQVVFRDISKRKEAERQLQRSEKRFRSIIEQSVDGIMLTNEAGEIVEWNPGMEHITGYGRDVAVGMSLGEMTSRLLPDVERRWAEIHKQKNPVPTSYEAEDATQTNDIEERTIQTIHGQSRIVQVMTFDIPTEAGAMRGSIFRDVTEKIAQDRQMQQQERMAAVGQLAAGIAHDFNNILAVIMLYADMVLRSNQLPPRATMAIKTIIQQSSRAAELIQQVLDFSRRTVLEKQLVDLRPLLQNLADMWQRTLPSSIQLQLDAGQDDVTVHADPTRIQQIFMNLVVNARDAMPDGGQLSLSLQRILAHQHPTPGLDPQIEEWVKVTVTDTGCGIPPDVIPRLFEPFFTTKEPGKGTGLGLAQVYGIVKQHDGHIELTSEVNKGTTFTLFFPALAQPPLLDETTEWIGLHLGQNQTILLIEDDPFVREALINSLTALKYKVISAHDGQEALEIGRQHYRQIDLILSDMMMPRLSGLRLRSLLPAELKSKPFVLLTGHLVDEDQTKLEEMGIAGWLMKPVALEKLSQLLYQILQNP